MQSKISEILRRGFEKRKNKNYIYEKTDGTFKGRTFGDFIRDAYGIAHYLLDKGMLGKTVIIIGPNSYELMAADLAATAFVGISAVLARALDDEAVVRLARGTGCGAVIYSPEKETAARRLQKTYGALCLCTDEIASLPNRGLFNLPDRDSEICSKIVFSSGTTGPSKGVRLSIKNILAGYDDFYRRLKLSENDSAYLFLPLNHTYADIYHFFYSLIGGYSLWLASSTQAVAEELREVNPTVFCAVPLIFERLIARYGENISRAFGTNIRYVVTGGAPCGSGLRSALSGVTLIQTYALTETASSFAIDYPDNRDSESSGTIFESIDAKVFQPDGNGIGELIVKGDCVFLGYLDPALDSAAFDGDGYFHTGDLGYIRGGKVYLKGRKKKILLGSNGENIDVSELESLMKSLDDNIVRVCLSLNGNRLTAYIYTYESADMGAVVDSFNRRVLPHERISGYSSCLYSPEGSIK